MVNMTMKGKSSIMPRGLDRFVASLVIISLFLSILLFLCINEPAHLTMIDSPNSNHVDLSGTKTDFIWINTTKTTGGWPFLKNDVYNTMGLKLIKTGYNDSGEFVNIAGIEGFKEWHMFFTLTSIASSRVKNTNESSSSITSQSLTVECPNLNSFNDYNLNVAGIKGICSNAYQSWPGNSSPPNYSGWPNEDYSLYSAVITDMNKSTNFSISPSQYANLQTENWYSNNLWNTGQPNIVLMIKFPYSNNQHRGVSDCGYTYHIDYFMSPGSTHEFNLITNTNWGLDDTSQAILHVNITAPPDPSGMSDSELEKYGIRTEYNRNGDILQYGIDPTNISIEVT